MDSIYTLWRERTAIESIPGLTASTVLIGYVTDKARADDLAQSVGYAVKVIPCAPVEDSPPAPVDWLGRNDVFLLIDERSGKMRFVMGREEADQRRIAGMRTAPMRIAVAKPVHELPARVGVIQAPAEEF